MTIGGGDAVDLGDRLLLADTHGAALVASDGTLDWWCPGPLDGEPALWRLLDPAGAALRVGPARAAAPWSGVQRYEEGCLVARTTLPGRESLVEVVDALLWDGHHPPGRLVRLLSVLRGPCDVAIDIVPGSRWLAARDVSVWSTGAAWDGTIVRADVPFVLASRPLPGDRGRRRHLVIEATARLGTGERLVVTLDAPGTQLPPLSPDAAARLLDRTATAWRRVLAPGALPAIGADVSARSVLVLRALSASGTGGLVGAPTTSLPTVVGGERNDDGRVVSPVTVAGWAEMAATLGLGEEADAAGAWLAGILDHDLPLPSALAVDGSQPTSQRTVPSIRGWRSSEPVRVGSDAGERRSLEPVAATLDAAASLMSTAAGSALAARWDRLCELAGWLAEHYRDPDRGVWDQRQGGRELLAPLLVARHALHRVTSLAWGRNPLDLEPLDWHHARIDIDRHLTEHAVGPGAVLRAFGDGPAAGPLAGAADAAVLRVAWLGPWPSEDRVVQATIDDVRRRLGSGPWLLAYPPELDDGRPGVSGPSVTATLWLVRALAEAQRWDEAYGHFDAVVSLAGRSGLLAENVDTLTGAARGNRPSAGAHVAFLQAARALSRGPA